MPYHRTGAEVSDTSSVSACSSHKTLAKSLHLSVLKTLIYRGSVISPLTCFSPVISDTDSTAEDLQTSFPAMKPQDKENKASADAKISKPSQPDCAHHFVMGEKFSRGVQAPQQGRAQFSFAGFAAKPLCSSQNSNVQTSVLLFQTHLRF